MEGWDVVFGNDEYVLNNSDIEEYFNSSDQDDGPPLDMNVMDIIDTSEDDNSQNNDNDAEGEGGVVESAEEEVRVPSLKHLCFRVIADFADGVDLPAQQKKKRLFQKSPDTAPFHKDTTLPPELRQEYIEWTADGDGRKELLDRFTVVLENRVIYAMHMFDAITKVPRRRRPLVFLFSENAWHSLWNFFAPMSSSTDDTPYQTIYLQLLWLTLHDQLPLHLNNNERKKRVLLGAAQEYMYFCSRHICGRIPFSLGGARTASPLLETSHGGEFPLTPDEVILPSRGSRGRPKWCSRKLYSLLSSLNNSEEHAGERRTCTYSVTGPTYDYTQPTWICLECRLGVENLFWLCHNCALHHHDLGHHLIYKGLWKGFCDMTF